MVALWLGGVGWIFPPFYVRIGSSTGRRRCSKALPDALDMLVVCVEAGLGLNQALRAGVGGDRSTSARS